MQKKERKQVTPHRSTYKVAGIQQSIQVATRAYKYFLCQAFHAITKQAEATFQSLARVASATDVFHASFVFLCINMIRQQKITFLSKREGPLNLLRMTKMDRRNIGREFDKYHLYHYKSTASS